jgi:hypothetical protein
MARIFPYNLKQASVVAAVCCLIAGGLAALDAPRAGNDQPVSISVNRAKKGDQLPSAALAAASVHRPSSATKGPPLGCDPLFSSITDPAKARLYYRRCAV